MPCNGCVVLAAWTQSLEAYQLFVFRQCSLARHHYYFLPPGAEPGPGARCAGQGGQEGGKEGEGEACLAAAREKIIFDLTKTLSNLLSELPLLVPRPPTLCVFCSCTYCPLLHLDSLLCRAVIIHLSVES